MMLPLVESCHSVLYKTYSLHIIVQKRTIRRWRLDKFGDDVVREKYCEALQAEVEAFSDRWRKEE